MNLAELCSVFYFEVYWLSKCLSSQRTGWTKTLQSPCGNRGKCFITV